MKENGRPETGVERFIFSRLNIRTDLADFPKIIEGPESLKIYYFYPFRHKFGKGYNPSCELFKKYPDEVRVNNIDDADIFAFVCSKIKDEYWIHQDVKPLLDYARDKNKIILPIISDFSLGYEIITIADFNTDLSIKIFDIDDKEIEEPEYQEPEPEITKYGADIEEFEESVGSEPDLLVKLLKN